MKKKSIKVGAILLACVMGVTPVFACTTTPHDINTSKPAEKPARVIACKTCKKDITTGSAVAPDETRGESAKPAKEKELPSKVQPAPTKPIEPAKVQPAPMKPIEPHKKQGAFVIDNFKAIQCTLEKLGVSQAELEGMIKQGKTLSDVLKDKDINVNKFQKALLKQYYCTVKEAQNKGQITKEEAKQLKGAIKQKVMSWQPKK